MTRDQEFLAAIHDQLGETNRLLRQLRQLLERTPSPPPSTGEDGTVELTEPKPPAPSAKAQTADAGSGAKRKPAGSGSRPAQRNTTARKTTSS
ncbi:hypothetical protein [Actinoallomurus sp. CA-142502]|uniref:hypothetical protein n=1 Tax=Actinoallomurus sp. CA-142502 TaxID=3239885 RepID=UPI003D8F05DA